MSYIFGHLKVQNEHMSCYKTECSSDIQKGLILNNWLDRRKVQIIVGIGKEILIDKYYLIIV